MRRREVAQRRSWRVGSASFGHERRNAWDVIAKNRVQVDAAFEDLAVQETGAVGLILKGPRSRLGCGVRNGAQRGVAIC